jgi:hypothetical protein
MTDALYAEKLLALCELSLLFLALARSLRALNVTRRRQNALVDQSNICAGW